MTYRKSILKFLTLLTVAVVSVILITNSGIQSDVESIFHDRTFSTSQPNHQTQKPQIQKMENITLNFYYKDYPYSLHLEVNRSMFRKLQNLGGTDAGYLYLYNNFTSNPSSNFRIYSTFLSQDSGKILFRGITHLVELLIVLWVAKEKFQLTFHSMHALNTTFTASYNASSYWNELSQQIKLGTGWVFNHINFVGSAISALEKLLPSSTEYEQVENFIMFMYTLFSGSRSLKENESTGHFNSVISTLIKYNVVNSSTYSDIDILNGINHLDNVSLHVLTVSLFKDLYGASYLPAAVSIGTSVIHILENDSISIGINGAIQVANNLAVQESIDDSVFLAFSDVSISFITVGFPLALIAAFADLLSKYIQVPLKYIGVEYHIEKEVYGNLSKRYTTSMAHLTKKGEPNLSGLSNAANYYIIILAFISLWYYVNMHLYAGNKSIVHRDMEALNYASKMIQQFNLQVKQTI